ncbi:MAG: hypothetical protein R3C53_14375 [Pirellulaceae bacterium]
MTSTRSTLTELKIRRWLLPIAIFLFFLVVAWYADRAISKTLEAEVTNSLTTILKADVTALTTWLESEKGVLISLAQQPAAKRLLESLLLEATQVDESGLPSLAGRGELLESIAPSCKCNRPLCTL